jgi:uncharacterized phage protein (TIGR01671 family)
MKEIKFRAKIAECSDLWIYGYYVNTHDRHRIIYEDQEGYYCEEEVILETVGQYTGLKDKNGVKIYSDDIVNIKDYPISSPFIVIYRDGSYYFAELIDVNEYVVEDIIGYYEPEEIEVIGNKIDNPELLER